MAKARKTIKQTMQYPQQYAAWFSATQTLFNQVAAFYFEVIQAHATVLSLSAQKALNALETLTHATEQNSHPVMSLNAIAPHLPSMVRRAAIHAALGSARSFSSSLKKWRGRKEQAEARKMRFSERPPAPPRTWRRSTTLYAGQWKQRTETHILLKLWTGSCWSWGKVRLLSRAIPDGYEIGSPSLVRHGSGWYLHTPIEKSFTSPAKVGEQVAQLQAQVATLQQQLAHAQDTATGLTGASPSLYCPHPAEARRCRILPLIALSASGEYVMISPQEGELAGEPDSPVWFAWLASLSSFRFVGQDGRLTASRMYHQGPTRSWYGTRRIHQHQYSFSTGVTDGLTIARLEEIAAKLQSCVPSC